MLELDHAKVDLIAATFGLPVLAIVVMTGVDSLVDTEGWRLRLARLGWDLSVLGVGIIAGIFSLPQIRGQAPSDATLIGSFSLLFSVGMGVAITHLRKVANEKITGLRGLLAFGCGLAALALPWYFVANS